jgi:hypothetical protein
MKKLLFLGACLVALASQPVMAQTSGSDVVLVRFSRTSTGNLRTAITRGEGKTELSETAAGYNDKGFVQASEGEYKVLHQLYQEGYQLLTSTQEFGGAVSWVFAKK